MLGLYGITRTRACRAWVGCHDPSPLRAARRAPETSVALAANFVRSHRAYLLDTHSGVDPTGRQKRQDAWVHGIYGLHLPRPRHPAGDGNRDGAAGMTRQIWKFIIPFQDALDTNCIPIEMPDRAQFLTVMEQGGNLCLWAQINQTEKLVTRRFAVFGTGHEMPNSVFDYLGTVMFAGGSLVLHVYELWDDEPDLPEIAGGVDGVGAAKASMGKK